MNFKDKTVIITGASKGVGAACARSFAAQGANLVIVARGRRELDLIAVKLRTKTKVAVVPMDVADADACENLLKKAQFEFGAVHILVNNAGYHARGPFESVNAEEMARMVDVNLKAPIVLSRLVLPYLREAGEGAIINVASLAGMLGVPNSAVYSATKAGLRALTFALFEELQGTGIKVAAVSPGPIDTGFIMSNVDIVSDITFSQPISTDEEVANEILTLCSNNRREKVLPAMSGFLATFSNLVPGIARLIRPVLEKKGRRVKRELKAKARQASRAS
jgi:short-subunit dehydrogenase